MRFATTRISRVVGSGLAAMCLVGALDSTASAQQFVYVPHRIFGVIAYNLNLFGALTPIPGSPFGAGTGPTTAAVDPFGRFAFVGNDVSRDVSAYTINPFTGALTQVAGSPFQLTGLPVTITVDPTGRFLYVVQLSAIAAFAINPLSGALTPITGSPFVVGTSLIGAAIDPFGRFLYAADTVDRNVVSFTIDFLTGVLTRVADVLVGTNSPVDLVADRSGRFVYVLDTVPSFSPSVVHQYVVNPFTGELTIAGETSAGLVDVSLALDGTGRFVYVAQALGPTTNGYAINLFTGGLTQIGTFLGTGYLTADPTGRFVLISSSGLLVYAINGLTGSLFPTAAVAGTPQSRAAVTGISWLALLIPH